MKISVDEEVAKKKGITLPEMFLSLFVKTGADLSAVLGSMMDREYIVEQNGRYLLTQSFSDKCDSVILDSDGAVPTEEELIEFSKELMSIMPQGKVPGTPYYYKCNSKEVTLKLQKFYKIYGTKWSKSDIKEAIQKYVDSFNGNYKYMRILKYVIWKRVDGGEEVSDLATMLENKDNPDTANVKSWLDDLR